VLPDALAVLDTLDVERSAVIGVSIGGGPCAGPRRGGADAPLLPAADQALFSDPVWLGAMGDGIPAMFAHGVQGSVDDRLADGPGWVSFDVSEVRAPVVVLHGSEDSIVDVARAHHTASIVPAPGWAWSTGWLASAS
jgi:pimeloyl-ACP methyl ester carboxylesterase